ncbi:MAG: Outer membrane protein OmpA [Verrucomicrobia bacterium]|nr:MAG: Outer membrane protein OmpA [Verrucomicrobiota bacterium]
MQATVNLPRREVPQSTVVYWFFAALLISLGLHGAFFVWSKAVPVDGLRDTGAPALLPPKFVVKQVNFDPKSLQDIPEKAPAPKKEPVLPEKLVFSDAKPQAVDVKLEVKPVDITSKLVEEKPKAQADPIAMAKLTQSTAGALDRELSSLAGAFLTSAPVSAAQPVLAVSSQLTKGASESPSGFGTGGAAMQGRQSLEDVLGGLGKVPTTDSPVAIPGNALFAHDSAELGPESLPILEKIADLRRRFPDYVMVIVGHTDNTGSPDYNVRLSARRAEAVKEWLVKRYGMAANKMDTMGRGSQELLVVSGNVDEQAPNRRVEVVLVPAKTKRGSQ